MVFIGDALPRYVQYRIRIYIIALVPDPVKKLVSFIAHGKKGCPSVYFLSFFPCTEYATQETTEAIISTAMAMQGNVPSSIPPDVVFSVRTFPVPFDSSSASSISRSFNSSDVSLYSISIARAIATNTVDMRIRTPSCIITQFLLLRSFFKLHPLLFSPGMVP